MENYNRWRPEVVFRVKTASIIATLAAILIGAFITLPGRRPEIQFIAFVLGGSAALYSAYHAGVTLRLNLHRDRQRRAYEILDSFNKFDSAAMRVAIDDAMAKASVPAVAYQAIRSDPNRDAGVRHVLGILEDMSIAVRTGYADEQVLFHSLRGAAAHYYDAFRPYIDELRRDRNSDAIFIELERLVGAWRTRRSLSDGTRLIDS